MADPNVYPAIGDHGLIGDLQTCALVNTCGTVDWFCCPRFDSPSVFASLLDDEKGGHFRITCDNGPQTTKQLYFPDTGILITRFMSVQGVAEIYDFMPIDDKPWEVTDHHALVRMIRVPRGQVSLHIDVAPRFDYGRQPHEVKLSRHGALFENAEWPLVLHSSAKLEQHGNDVGCTLTMREGQVHGFMLESAPNGAPRHITTKELDHLFRTTVGAWRNWLSKSSYQGRWRDMVNRAAITLKMLTYAPTGAPIAAATAGLPEQIGGERNWDYRYTWVRDASFSVQALERLGFVDDAIAFLMWIRDRVEDTRGGATGPLQVMYRVDGSTDLPEFTLDHFEGYRGSSPVRIGNAASEQLQLDIYGEMMDATFHLERDRPLIGQRGWRGLRDAIDWLCDNWDQPEEGIWETRGGRQPFVYGRMMCWAALDRAIRMSALTGARPAPIERWSDTRDAIVEQVLTKGFDKTRNALVQHYGSDVMDASALAALRLHFLVPTDEIWLGTLNAIEEQLVSDSLVYRYNPSASPDGLRGSEGTFSMCTFWYVDALTRTHRLDDARLVFEKMLTYANHLGLYAEEIGDSGEQLGNFPQAFTHLSLINAAYGLDKALSLRTSQAPTTA